MKYEEALRAVGGYSHSPYQLKVLTVCCICNFVSGFIMTSFPFLSQAPDFLCLKEKAWVQCEAACGRSPNTWKIDPESFKSIAVEYQLICEREWLMPYIAFSMMFGGLLGTLLFSLLLDLIGRRNSNLSAIGLTFLGLQAGFFSTTSYGILLSFFICGLGASPLSIISKVNLSEFIGGQRGVYLQMATVAFGLGRAGNVVLAMYFQQWRPMILVVSLITVSTLVMQQSLHESPKFALFSAKDVKLTVQILSAIRSYNKIENTQEIVIQPSSPSTEKHHKPSLFQPRYRVKLSIQSFHYFVTGCSYYILVFNQQNMTKDLYLTGLLFALTEILSGFAAACIGDSFGRKAVYYSHFPLATLLTIGSYNIQRESAFAPWINGAMSYAISTCAAMPSVLTGELFPTAVRGRAYSVSTFFLRAGGMVAPLIVRTFQNTGLDPVLCVGFLSFLSVLPLPLLPETRGKEVIEDDSRTRRVWI